MLWTGRGRGPGSCARRDAGMGAGAAGHAAVPGCSMSWRPTLYHLSTSVCPARKPATTTRCLTWNLHSWHRRAAAAPCRPHLRHLTGGVSLTQVSTGGPPYVYRNSLTGLAPATNYTVLLAYGVLTDTAPFVTAVTNVLTPRTTPPTFTAVQQASWAQHTAAGFGGQSNPGHLQHAAADVPRLAATNVPLCPPQLTTSCMPHCPVTVCPVAPPTPCASCSRP